MLIILFYGLGVAWLVCFLMSLFIKESRDTTTMTLCGLSLFISILNLFKKRFVTQIKRNLLC